jgi:NTP pyrophosphatase (non-canonical NTP hydrolase)
MNLSNIDEYAAWTETVWISHNNGEGFNIATLGLAGETGEVMEVLKKRLRDGKFDVENFKKEMGDVIYYWVKLLNYLAIKPSDVLQLNHDKLESRKERNVLSGSGDNR